MDGLLSLVGADPALYFNISLAVLLQRCHPAHKATVQMEDDEPVDVTAGDDADFSAWVGEAVSWLLGEGGDGEGGGEGSLLSLRDKGDDCDDVLRSSIGGSMSAASVLKLCVGAFLALVLLSVTLRLAWKKLSAKADQEKSAATKDTIGQVDAAKLENKEDPPAVKNVGAMAEEMGADGAPDPKLVVPVVISLAGSSISPYLQEAYSFVSQPDNAQFLSNTAEHLQAQLDWLLGLGGDESSISDEPASATAAASLLTPKVYRKRLMRRPRWQTMASLPLGAGSTSPDDKMAVRMWQKLEDMERKMNWKQLDVGQLDISAVEDSRLSAVLQFYQQACPVRAEQWNASCLIVNYVLVLLEQELSAARSDRSPLTFLQLQSFGSARSQTCISRANRFDVMLTVQVPNCSEMSVYHCEVCDEIPAGKVVLGFKEAPSSTSRTPSHLLLKDRIGELFGTFLSAKEVVKTMQRLVSGAVDRLKLRNKVLLDRLTFSVQMAHYDDLLLCINTKALSALGLGLSEITIRLTPALQVSSQDTAPLPPIFAVPPWNVAPDSGDASRSRVQSRIMRSRVQGVPGDLLWQLDCSELARSFVKSSEGRLGAAGVWGCQVVCQQLLRALFSRCGRDTLLAAGEVAPHVLDSVIFFLLLESPAESWRLACLPDRLSDCVHFLRAAVQSAWMPGFMVHNPHLLKQMPALQLLPLLTPSRQENLLAGMGSEAAEGVLAFMDRRLQETGLRRCLKEDYSTEMWEYEFFIFG